MQAWFMPQQMPRIFSTCRKTKVSLILMSYSHSGLWLWPLKQLHAPSWQRSGKAHWLLSRSYMTSGLNWAKYIYLFHNTLRFWQYVGLRQRRLRDKLFVMYIWILCFRKCIVAVSLSVPLSLKWEIILNLFYMLLYIYPKDRQRLALEIPLVSSAAFPLLASLAGEICRDSPEEKVAWNKLPYWCFELEVSHSGCNYSP